jgi:hypothetical protein
MGHSFERNGAVATVSECAAAPDLTTEVWPMQWLRKRNSPAPLIVSVG